MRYDFRCIMCGEEFECVQPMNAEHRAFHCGIEAKRVWETPNTEKDLAYNFTTDLFGKPQVIYAKNQFKTLLKQNGLVDASLKEVRQEANFRKRINEEGYSLQRRKTAENIFSKKRELLRFRVRR